MGINLVDTVLEYVEQGGYYLRSQKFNSSLETSKVPKEYKLNLPFESNNLQSIDTYLKLLKEYILSGQFDSSKVIGNIMNCSEGVNEFLKKSKVCIEKMGILLPPLDLDVYICSAIEELDGLSKEMLNFADSKLNTHEDYLFKWLSSWKFNVNKVKKLYTVRYEEKVVSADKAPSPTGKFYVSLWQYIFPFHWLITRTHDQSGSPSTLFFRFISQFLSQPTGLFLSSLQVYPLFLIKLYNSLALLISSCYSY